MKVVEIEKIEEVESESEVWLTNFTALLTNDITVMVGMWHLKKRTFEIWFFCVLIGRFGKKQLNIHTLCNHHLDFLEFTEIIKARAHVYKGFASCRSRIQC